MAQASTPSSVSAQTQCLAKKTMVDADSACNEGSTDTQGVSHYQALCPMHGAPCGCCQQ